jgi:ABC-2 type transport system ATP-binding protein
VFVSSHLMAEMALTADHLVVIGRGRLIADTSVADFVARPSSGRVRVSSPDSQRLHQLIAEKASEMSPIVAGVDGDSPGFTVSGLARSAIGDLAVQYGIAIHELLAAT